MSKVSLNNNGLRIGLLIGHTNLRPGAKNKSRLAEHHYYLKILNEYFCNPDGKEYAYDVFAHSSYNLGYEHMCKTTAKSINAEIDKNGDYDIIFALHFNASESEQAHGAEVLHYFSNEKSAKIGRLYLRKLKQEFGSRNRGLKPLYKKSQRGFSELYYPKSSVCTLEPFFSTNDETGKFSTDTYGPWFRNFIDNLYINND